jgi:hypothetical protein
MSNSSGLFLKQRYLMKTLEFHTYPTTCPECQALVDAKMAKLRAAHENGSNRLNQGEQRCYTIVHPGDERQCPGPLSKNGFWR